MYGLFWFYLLFFTKLHIFFLFNKYPPIIIFLFIGQKTSREHFVKTVFLFHQVFTQVCGLLAFHTLHHLARFCGVGDHAYRVVVAHIFPQPVEQHHHLVLYTEDGAKVNDEPKNPGEETLAAQLADLHHRLVAANGCHGAEVVIFKRCESTFVLTVVDELQVLGKVLGLLYSDLGHLWVSVGISLVGGLQTLVADGKHAVQAVDGYSGLP